MEITRAHLESLTTLELVRMADSLGIDIPPDLDRIFIIQELLEISAPEDTGPENPDAPFGEIRTAPILIDGMIDTVQMESVPIPKQYNITFIEVMIRDPFWAFVFWEIKSSEKEQYEKIPDFSGYQLKISPLVSSADSFAIPIKPEDRAWYLGLTDGFFQDIQRQYKVELCACTKNGETVLAVSNPFKLLMVPARTQGPEPVKPLVCLSGSGDFHILRNNERSLRVKRSVNPSHE